FYFCAFQGNDGTLLVTQESNYLYTDGRYWTEAEDELKGTNCQLVKAGKPGVPTIQEFIKANNLYPLGLDASLFSLRELQSFYFDYTSQIKSINYSSMIDSLPELPQFKIWKVNDSLLSSTRQERVASILKYALDNNASSVLLTALDDISYVLGYRGNDIPYTPVFYSYLFIESTGFIHLFIDTNKIGNEFHEDKVIIHAYDSLISFLDKRSERILVDLKKSNAMVAKHVHNPVNAISPAYIQKAVKGQIEIANTKRVHEIDGVAVLRLQKFIDENIDKGLDEEMCAEYINALRLANSECYDLSFETIAAADSNAAMMHYAPSKEKHSPLTRENQLLLVDSGGQYYGGTTDITRTFLVNRNPDPEVVHDYTLTLKSQIALSRTIFEKGCSGHSIDITAREVMWKEGLDYKCGTGHGVSYMGPVHEGPIGFRYYTRPGVTDDGILEPGHIITIEPGVYKDHKHGIRLENELLVVPAFENNQGIFYKFETITYCPYDRKGIDLSMLDDEEIKWLNDYLVLTYEKLSPLVKDDEGLHEYLVSLTKPFSR
ncbi:MAG: M24 family metallopeptidase, partial [Bacilli bacterium]